MLRYFILVKDVHKGYEHVYHLSHILSPMVLSLADYISDDEPTSSVAHTLSRNHVEAHNVSQLEHPLYHDKNW